ncbi:MAG: DNA repair protein, partial [Ktedonobacteraceae bacterium]
LDAIRLFLKQRLPFNSATTRERCAHYVIRRMFPDGVADQGFLHFARAYAGQRAWREACFYRFCKAEPQMYEVIEDFIRPALGVGQMPRNAVRKHLEQRFPGMPSTKHAALAVVEALVSGGLAKANRETLYVSYREPTLAGFAFVVQSEFPEPGMFNIVSLEQNRALRAMLWQPTSLLSMLYELRNKQIISAISEIDALRQFTTRYSFEQVCEILAQTRM